MSEAQTPNKQVRIQQLVKSLAPLAAGTVLLLAGLFCGWQTWLIATRNSTAQVVYRAQTLAVDRIADLLARQRAAANGVLKNPGVLKSLQQGDAEGRAAAGKLADTLMPPGGSIEFFSPTLQEVVGADYKTFGYARAAQLLAAQSSDAKPVIQARLKPKGVAFTLVEPVGSKDSPLAYAWIELPFAPVRDVLTGLQVGSGRLELRLGDDADGLMLASDGSTSALIPALATGKPIPGSKLRIVAALPKAWIVLPKSMLLAGGLALMGLLGGLGLLWQRHRALHPVEQTEEDGEVIGDFVKKKGAAKPVPVRTKQEPEPDPEAAMPDIDPTIFRAYDIRGVVGKSLNADVARLIGQAIGSLMRDKELSEIVIGRDGRLSGPELSDALAQGLRLAGIDVIDIGAVPTPLVYFAAYHFNTGSGVAVTGSHNPPDYNGFKIVVGGETLSEDAIQDLYRRIVEGRLQRGGLSESRRLDVVGEYMDRIADDVQAERPLKVVVDAGNGIAGAIGPQVLEAIGCEVIPLYCEVDGAFPNHHPDPSDPHNLQDLILMVKNANADIGLAFDGDGDRLGVVTREGEIIYPDRLLMLFARDVLSRNPGATIIYDVKCTGHLQSDILNAGGSPLMWRTGHSLIKAKMRETEALLAGEMSGHFFFRERWYGFDDGVYSAARLMEILAGDLEERSPDEIFATLPKGVSTPELKIELKEGQNYTFIKAFREKAEFEGARLTTIDGLRADWKDGWGLVRASNTTPVLVLRFDADNEAALKRIQQAFREQLLAVGPNLKLPF